MLQGIINRAEHSIDALASKYVMRVLVAVPLVVALGFGTAAAAVRLSQDYGSTTAYTILAAAFAGIGLAAASAVALSGPKRVGPADTAEPVALTDDTSGMTSSFDPQVLLAAVGAIGPAALPGLLRLLARNLPLVLAVVILAFLLFSKTEEGEGATMTGQSE
jgi:hypothetical protein